MKNTLSGKLISLACLIFFSTFCDAQEAAVKQIRQVNPPGAGLRALRVLASDEMMGRATTRPEIHVAARYIAEEFRSAGLREVPGANNYFQSFTIHMVTPAKEGLMEIDGKKYEAWKDWVQMAGKDMNIEAPLVYVHYGNPSDLNGMDIKGKIVLTEMGTHDTSSFMEGFFSLEAKQKRLKQLGALAIIERFKRAGVGWADLANYAQSERPSVEEEGENMIPVFILDDSAGDIRSTVQQGRTRGVLQVSGTMDKTILAKNVMGWVPGTDPALRNEYILLSAHYDHIGIARKPVIEDGKLDSIYNGARDNAIGSAAVIDAARYFSKFPAKRSILCICYTGEEIGLIGSNYFAGHPLVPLNRIVYNLNIDNASYNDTSIVSVIGLGRTSEDLAIKVACNAFGLKARPDPAPEENLFDRSDNVSLAAKGVPAPTFSLGMKKFDAEIQKRYHQLSDEVGNFNLSYGMKFINAFILSAKLIADNRARPTWVKGDKYEASWKELYRQ